MAHDYGFDHGIHQDQRHRGRDREATRPAQISSTGWKDILGRVKAGIRNDNVTLLAAGVAFYATLALFPTVIAAVTLYGLVGDPAQVEQQIGSLVGGMPQAGPIILNQIRKAVASSSSVSLSIGAIAGLVGALYSASVGVNGIVRGVNVVYCEHETRGFLEVRVLALLLTLGALVAGLIAIGLVAVLPAVVGSLGLGPSGETLAKLLRWPILAVLMAAGLALIYRYAPDRQNARLEWVSWGAVIATVLWLGGSALFSLYMSNFNRYGAAYGSISGIIILLLWLFLSSFVVLLGAEINAEMERQTRQDTTAGEEKPLGRREAQDAGTMGEPAD
ncbi:MAG: YihY/virulence factor BrkB family protein [Egibacteraceae bacterium]